MSTDFRLLKRVLAVEIFDGRLEEFDVHEHMKRLIPLFQVCLDVLARCELPICADCRVG